MFKLGSIETIDTTEIELKHPVSGVGLGAFVTVAGPAHPAHQGKLLERNRRTLLMAALEGKEKAMERGLDEAQQSRIELAIACTVGWRGMVNGEELEVAWSPQKAMEVLSDKRHGWIVDQVSDALLSRDRFIKDSASG